MAQLVVKPRAAWGERGAVLGFAIMTAFLASLAAYAMLVIAASQAQHARFHREHASARHAAEAGLVWARERLTREFAGGPTFCGTPGPPDINGMSVEVTVSPCPGGWPRTVSSTVTY